MHISDRFVTVCYNIIHCIVFNFVIVIDVLIFTNSPFLFILSKFTPLFRSPHPTAYLIIPNVLIFQPSRLLGPPLFGTQEYSQKSSNILSIIYPQC